MNTKERDQVIADMYEAVTEMIGKIEKINQNRPDGDEWFEKQMHSFMNYIENIDQEMPQPEIEFAETVTIKMMYGDQSVEKGDEPITTTMRSDNPKFEHAMWYGMWDCDETGAITTIYLTFEDEADYKDFMAQIA